MQVHHHHHRLESARISRLDSVVRAAHGHMFQRWHASSCSFRFICACASPPQEPRRRRRCPPWPRCPRCR
jgi:hypothetical protein